MRHRNCRETLAAAQAERMPLALGLQFFRGTVERVHLRRAFLREVHGAVVTCSVQLTGQLFEPVKALRPTAMPGAGCDR
jgi:hypothetical protein